MSDEPRTLPKVDLPEPPPEEFPRPFGNYLLLAPLARGGMGEVFLAKRGSVAGLEKHCVVKTLRPHLTDDREYTSRFIDEARIVVQLSHRNICHVFDVGTVGERYYLAMEYIAGKDLRALAGDVAEGTTTQPGGVINPGLAVHIVSETLEALDYAHRQVDAASGVPLQLVHRDVSPQNVMLSWEGEVKLIDFGLAASTLKVEQTSPNVVMGKLAYMAPEQVRGEKVDGRADLFAAGVMMYELLVGERFYEGRSPYEIWGIAAQGGFRPRGWHHLDDDMKLVLDRALAGTPGARFATCIEMREALQSYLQARALRGDAPMLRALMQAVYAPQIEETRRQLAMLSKATLSTRFGSGPNGPHGPISAPHDFPAPAEPTVSLARSPSTSLEHKRRVTDAEEGTEPTDMNVRPAQPSTRRAPLAAAAVVLLAVAAVVAVVTSRVDAVTALFAPAATAVAPVTTPVVAPVTTPVVAPVTTPIVADADVAPVVADAGVVPVDEPVVAPDAPRKRDPKKSAKGAKAAKGAKGEDDARDAKDGDAKDGDAKDGTSGTNEVVDAKPAGPPSYKALGNWSLRADALTEHCAQHACTQKVAVHRRDWGSLDAEPFAEWKAAVAACWQACGLPP